MRSPMWWCTIAGNDGWLKVIQLHRISGRKVKVNISSLIEIEQMECDHKLLNTDQK